MSDGGWTTTTIGSVADVTMGQSPPSQFVSEDEKLGLPFLQGNAEFGATSPSPTLWCTKPGKTAIEGDSLISVRAPVGDLNLADQNYCIGRGLAAVRFTSVDSGFGRHQLALSSRSLQRVAQGSTFDAIGSKELRGLLIQRPHSRFEQRRIAEILDTVYEQIRRTEQIIAKRKLVKRGLLQDLLTHGIDQEGNLRDPHSQAEQFEDTPSGPIPNDWERTPFDALMVDIRYGTSAPSDDDRAGLPVLRIPNVQNGTLELSDLKYQRPSRLDRERYRVATNDLLVIRTNGNPRLLGRCAYVRPDAGEFLFASYLIRIRVDEGRVVPSFAARLLNAERTRSYIETRAATSAGNYNINTAQLRAMPFLLPRIHEQVAILKVLDEADSAIDKEMSLLQKLRLLRLGMMSDLLTGRVRVQAEAVS